MPPPAAVSRETAPKARSLPPGLLTKPDCRAARKLAKTMNFYEFVDDMSAEFGAAVSLSPKLFMFTASDLIKETLRNTQDFHKDALIDTTFKILVGEGLFTAEGRIYDQQERVIKSAFGKKYFGEFRRIIDDECERHLDEAFERSSRDGKPFDLCAQSVDLTMSIAARSFFGVGGETELARRFRKGLVFVQDWFAKLQAAHFAEPMLRHIEDSHLRLPILKSLQRSVFRGLSGSGEMVEAIAEWKAFASDNHAAVHATAADMRAGCAKIIELRRRDGDARGKNDVLTSLLRFQSDPENTWLTDEVVIDQVATFFVAGHETTSDLFVTLLWKHARGETPKEVVAELESASDMICEEQFLFQRYPAAYAYLSRVLLEHPPIVFTVRQAQRDVEAGGYAVPRGTTVILALNAAQDIDVAFGFGRRQCIGRVFALEEAVLGLRRLIRFELALEDPAQRPQMTQGLTIGYSRSPVPILARSKRTARG